MKNYYLCISIVALSFQISYAQNEYYVATKIEELMNEEIFQWAVDSGGIDSLKTYTFEKSTDGNKFVNFESSKKIADKVKLLSSQELAVLDQLFQFNNKSITSLGSIDYQLVKQVIMKLNPQANLQGSGSIAGFGVSQSEIITAIADVVVERAKQELAKMYFDKLADIIDRGITVYDSTGRLYFSPRIVSTSHTIALDSILPNTYSFLRNSADRMTPEMGQTFKNAFTKDLEMLFPNLIEYALPDTYKQTHLVDDYALSSYTFIMSLIGNAGFYVASDELFATLINDIPTNNIPTINTGLLTDVLRTVRVLNSSLVNNTGAYTINAAQFRNMNPATFALYLNLLSINPNLPVAVRAVLQSNGNRDQFNRFVSSIDQVRLTLDAIGDLESAEEKINAISLACNSFLDAYSAGIEITNSLITIDLNTIMDLRRFANYSRRGVEFSTSLYTQNYANSALVALNFIRDTYSDTTMNKDLFKYITLIADISHAQNTQEVRTIVDRAILPVGSYAIKRSTGFSVAVNAYAGIAVGREWTNQGSNNWSSAGAAIGFSLPIGISINWSKGDEDNMAHSNTFFLSLLDLGAIANYNLGNTEDDGETISTAPEITFANVFSPGFSYIYGCKKSPVSISLGGQYMPNLREITDASNIVLGTADAVQLKLGILVDVPLFNVVMKGRR